MLKVIVDITFDHVDPGFILFDIMFPSSAFPVLLNLCVLFLSPQQCIEHLNVSLLDITHVLPKYFPRLRHEL